MRALQILLLGLLVTLGGCEAIATIFEAGLWVGVIGVLLILGIVWFIVSRLRGPRR
jgi:hypothetical protein